MVADIFNCRVVTLEYEEAGTMGAALQALWCWENHSSGKVSLKELVDRYVSVGPAGACQHDPGRVRLYNDIYQSYSNIVQKLYS